jgi:hypothetical protein
VGLETSPVALGLAVVFIEDGLANFDLATRRRRRRFVDVARLAGRMEMRMVMVMVVPRRMTVVMRVAVTRLVLMPVVRG